MQLPHSRSDESTKSVCSPNGRAQSLLVLPNRANVEIPEIHDICIRPESSLNTNFEYWSIANASATFVLSISVIKFSSKFDFSVFGLS